jgi:peptidoglycan-N-acetylglucosamine deacetylase
VAPVPPSLSRRVLLAGAAGWALAGCGGTTAPPAASTAATPAAPVPRLPGLPDPVRAVAGACGPAGRARRRHDRPQQYLPCAGTTIALTVDDGPDPRWTPRLLELLDRHRVTATFSMVGRQVTAHRGLVAEVAAAGHVVANHTWSHPELRDLSPGRVEREVLRAGDAVEQVTGHRPTLFRAPGGGWSTEVLALCAREGLTPLGWSVDPRDWSRPGTRQIAEVILRQTRPGSIILEHDGGGDRRQTLDALAVVLPRLLEAGYVFGHP